jgi:transposase-like protein
MAGKFLWKANRERGVISGLLFPGIKPAILLSVREDLMPAIDFVTCPDCKSRSWYDRIAVGNNIQTMRFKCTRCGKVIKLSGCSQCRAYNWIRENDFYEKGSKKPVVRYSCGGCGRVIGLFLEHG